MRCISEKRGNCVTLLFVQEKENCLLMLVALLLALQSPVSFLLINFSCCRDISVLQPELPLYHQIPIDFNTGL